MPKFLPQLEPSQAVNNLIIDKSTNKLKVKKSTKTIETYDVWRTAFDTLISVFASRKCNAGKIGGMLQYAHEIEGLSKDGYDWITYDKCYRLERANLTKKPCWSQVNQRLYNATIRKGKVNGKHSSFRNETKSEQSRFESRSSNNDRYPSWVLLFLPFAQ